MTTQELYLSLGANYEEAKTRLMNDGLIERFLGKFADTYSIEPLLEAGERMDAFAIFEAAHGLKGVVGNLALTRLFELSSNLTEKVRGLAQGVRIDCRDDIAAIQVEFTKTVATIKEYLAK